MKIDRLRIVADAIDAQPSSYDQAVWGGLHRSETGAVCGTAGCIAGWTVALFSGEIEQEEDTAHENAARAARRILDLTDWEAEDLFYFTWPVRWADPDGNTHLCDADAVEPSAEDAAFVLRRLADGDLVIDGRP